MQIGTPPQTVSLVKLEVELQGVSKHGTNRVIFQLCHGLTMLLVETDGFGSLQRTEHNPLGRLAPRLEHLVCSLRVHRDVPFTCRPGIATIIDRPTHDVQPPQQPRQFRFFPQRQREVRQRPGDDTHQLPRVLAREINPQLCPATRIRVTPALP